MKQLNSCGDLSRGLLQELQQEELFCKKHLKLENALEEKFIR